MYKKSTLKFCAFLLLTFSINAQTNSTKSIDSLLNICFKRGVFNGNALVAQNDTIIYQSQKGYTNGSRTKEHLESSVFDIGSISKEFNAVAIMMLKEKGLLNLDDTVSKFNLELPKWSKNITIAHLLKYSSGLPAIDWENVHGDTDIYSNLKALRALDFKPGDGYLYSNNNIFIQRRIIEKITGKSYNKYLEEEILEPLGMKNSTIDQQFNNPNFVRAFNNDYINDPIQELKMSGWVCPSIGDLYKWINALMSYSLISESSTRILFESYDENSQSALGESKFIGDKLVTYSHQGSSLNYESFVYFNKEKDLKVILMTNNKNFKLGEITEAITNILDNKPYNIPQKSVYLTIRERCYENVDRGIKYYHNLKTNSFDVYNFSNEWELARLGYKLFERNNNEGALRILKLMIIELPTKAEHTLFYLGNRILNENQTKKALMVYQLLVDKYPTDKAFVSYADALYKINNVNDALTYYKKALSFNPKNEQAQKRIKAIKE